MQIGQQLLGFFAISRQVRGENVHVISGTDGFLLFLDFCFIQIGDGALDGLNGTDLIHRLDMEIHNDIAFNVQEILQHTVTEFRGENL